MVTSYPTKQFLSKDNNIGDHIKQRLLYINSLLAKSDFGLGQADYKSQMITTSVYTLSGYLCLLLLINNRTNNASKCIAINLYTKCQR